MAETQTPEKPKVPMNQQDRRALAKVIDQRFKLLESEFMHQRDRLQREIRDQILADAKDRCEAAAQRMQPLIARLEALQKEIESEAKKTGKELGVFPGVYYETTVYDDRNRDTGMVKIQSRKQDMVALTIRNDWAPGELEAEIQRRFAEMMDDRTLGGRTLEGIRITLQEKLLTEGLDGTAVEFLAQIPSVTQLVPELPALERGKKK